MLKKKIMRKTQLEMERLTIAFGISLTHFFTKNLDLILHMELSLKSKTPLAIKRLIRRSTLSSNQSLQTKDKPASH